MFISKDIVFIEDDDDDYFEKNTIKFNLLAYVSRKWPQRQNQGEMKPNTKRRLKGQCRGNCVTCFSIVYYIAKDKAHKRLAKGSGVKKRASS